MARQFGNYSPSVPLGITWEDTFEMVTDDGTPVDLTGYAVRAQVREDVPDVDPATGAALEPPVFELTSAGYYATPPGWPVFEAFTIETPTTGIIALAVTGPQTWTGSPDNAKRALVWDVRLVNPQSGYSIPVIRGRPRFGPAVTV